MSDKKQTPDNEWDEEHALDTVMNDMVKSLSENNNIINSIAIQTTTATGEIISKTHSPVNKTKVNPPTPNDPYNV